MDKQCAAAVHRSSRRVQVTISEFNPYTKTYAVYPTWNAVNTAIASSYITLSGLTPGRCLSVSTIPYLSGGGLSTIVGFADVMTWAQLH